EDGIRDKLVTGVQTCALPISYRREENRAAGQPLFGDHPPGPLIVGAVGDDELDLVMIAELLEIRPAVLLHFARAGTFDVQDDLQIGRASCREACRAWWCSSVV